MAEAAISGAVGKLSDVLVERVSFLYGVKEEVERLKDELVRIQCFLRDAGEKQAAEEGIRNWISEIRGVAHDAEDVVEIFSLKVDAPRNLLAKFACFPKHLYRIHKIGEEIASINTRLKAIQTGRERYGILPEKMLFLRRLEDGTEFRRGLSPWQKDKEAVGLKKDVDLLLSKAILTGKKERAVAGIVGMGGIGKSTLARLVYHHSRVVNKFDPCRAWVVVSREFRPEEILREVVRQLLQRRSGISVNELEEIQKLQMPGLRHKLHQKLEGRPYFIVLDDVWEYQHWEILKAAFPKEDKASVLLLTSRRTDILRGEGYLHNMEALDPKESCKLLLNKAFIDKGKCPKDLEKIGRQIVDKCGGLPLVVTVAGGLLANRRQTKSEWEAFLRGMNSHLNRGDASPSAILELSYHNLPPNLKSCFLCLGFFKEDGVISAKRLLHVWISLGLIPHDKSLERMEAEARSYLDELVTLNLVQVKDLREGDRVKSLHIHDLLRDISIRKAKEEICFEILGEEAGTSQPPSKPRHRAVYCSRESYGYSVRRNKRVRSLFYHGAGCNTIEGSATYWRSFELLRVLEFQDFRLTELPEAVCEASGLRYLGLRNNLLQKLPSSMSRLKKLQVLDISRNLFIHVPNVVWKLVSLRHLYMLRIKCKAPLKLLALKNLQTLNYVQLDDCLLDNITHMTSLRKLGIELDINYTNVTRLSSSLASLRNDLVCLSLRQRGFQPMPVPTGLSALRSITQLKLRGAFELGGFPPSLSSLSLVGTWLDEDPMTVLENLPMLSYLRLDCAYKGQKLAVSPDGFSQLEILALTGLYELKEIKVGKGGMPTLRRLEINECFKLKSLPENLRSMSNFQAPK